MRYILTNFFIFIKIEKNNIYNDILFLYVKRHNMAFGITFTTNDIDRYFTKIGKFDILQWEEMYAMRRKFGCQWYGRIEITNLESTHRNEKERYNIILKNKYNIVDDISNIIYEYIITDISDRYKFINNINNINNNKGILDKNHKFLQKFIKIQKENRKEIEDKIGTILDLHIVGKELEKYRNKIYKNITQKINKIDIQECCICYDKKSNCITNCKHQFHSICLSKWIEVNKSCPLCRSNNLIVFDII